MKVWKNEGKREGREEKRKEGRRNGVLGLWEGVT